MKKYLKGSLLIIAALGLALAAAFTYHFYFLLPQSHVIFRWRHQLFRHLEMHPDGYGYRPSDSLRVALSVAPAKLVTLRLYDVLRKDTLWTDTLQGRFQPLSDSAAVRGTGWETHAFMPWANGSTGWYVLEAQTDNFTRRHSVFLQPSAGEVSHRIALLLSTHTWNAYNYWGGQSIYTAQNYTPTVSFERPQLLADPYLANTFAQHQLYYQAANKDRCLARLLDTASLGYDVYPMMALERADPRLAEYDVLIMATHSEYWSENMLRTLDALLDSGASLLNLAGNVAAYRTYFDPEARNMTIYRRVSELWQEVDSTGLRPFAQQPSFLGFHTYAPYQVIDTSWLLRGTGVGVGDLLGEQSNTYDYTYMYSSWLQNLWNLRNRGKMGAAAGLEVDVPYSGTPEQWVAVAKGLNPPVEGHGEVYPDSALDWGTSFGPEIGYYPHPGGGMVLSVGSMAFTGALPYDAALRKLVLNAIQRGLSRKN